MLPLLLYLALVFLINRVVFTIRDSLLLTITGFFLNYLFLAPCAIIVYSYYETNLDRILQFVYGYYIMGFIVSLIIILVRLLQVIHLSKFWLKIQNQRFKRFTIFPPQTKAEIFQTEISYNGNITENSEQYYAFWSYSRCLTLPFCWFYACQKRRVCEYRGQMISIYDRELGKAVLVPHGQGSWFDSSPDGETLR